MPWAGLVKPTKNNMMYVNFGDAIEALKNGKRVQR